MCTMTKDEEMCQTLTSMVEPNLVVKYRYEKGQRVFEFQNAINKQIVKTAFTYPKAKLFAEGYQCGVCFREKSKP